MTSMLNERARAATTSAIRDLLEHAQRPGMISLAGGLPDPSHFPTEEIAEIAETILRTDGARTLQYGLTAGELDLRHHIVDTTPVATSTAEVVVTTGSQQGLWLLAESLLDPGDTVVVSDPEYLGATQAFQRAGAVLVPVPADTHGLDVDALEDRLRSGTRPKVVYLVPNFHNPSGATLAPERQERLLELAEHHGFLVVFDDPYRDLHVEGPPPREPVPHPMAVHLRSSSKVLAPGLRVGWTIAPRWLAQAIERAKQAADLHTSTVSQAIVLGALTADWYPGHLDRLRASTRTKRDTLCAALHDRLGDRIEIERPGGGMFVWGKVHGLQPAGLESTDALLRVALDRGVAFVPGSAFAVQRDLSAYLRLSWATASPSELEQAVDRLAGTLEAT